LFLPTGSGEEADFAETGKSRVEENLVKNGES